MQQYYKDHPIYGFAVAEPGMLWHSTGLVFDPKHSTREVKRLGVLRDNFDEQRGSGRVRAYSM